MRRERAALAPLVQWGRTSGRLARRGFWPIFVIFLLLIVVAVATGVLWPGLIALVLVWPVAAAMVRRLHDMNMGGAWALLVLVPYVNALFALMLVFRGPYQRSSPYDRSDDALAGPVTVAGCAVFATLMLMLAAPVQMVRPGMKPVVEPGDVALVWRLGGGRGAAACWPLICPWGASGGPDLGAPVALIDPRSGAPIMARVMAVAGDEIAFERGQVVLNGTPLIEGRVGLHQEVFAPRGPGRVLPRCGNGAVGLGATCRKTATRERLPSGRQIVTLDAGPHLIDQMSPVTVPEGHVFVVSDNRDVGEDSRIAPSAGGLGIVKNDAVIGRVARVMISADGAHWWQVWTWRWHRIGKGVT